jgi:hypothetical protein
VVNLDVPSALVAVYGDCPMPEDGEMLPDGCTALVQLPSPSINAPEGWT